MQIDEGLIIRQGSYSVSKFTSRNLLSLNSFEPHHALVVVRVHVISKFGGLGAFKSHLAHVTERFLSFEFNFSLNYLLTLFCSFLTTFIGLFFLSRWKMLRRFLDNALPSSLTPAKRVRLLFCNRI